MNLFSKETQKAILVEMCGECEQEQLEQQNSLSAAAAPEPSLTVPSQHFEPNPINADIQALTAALASLRGLYLLHQNSHWQTQGDTFYADHLMFQRLYESAADDADKLAEKISGIYGSENLDIESQMAHVQNFLMGLPTKDLVFGGLSAEHKCLSLLEQAYFAASSMKSLTLGLDDLLMGISNNRETSMYLLGQKKK